MVCYPEVIQFLSEYPERIAFERSRRLPAQAKQRARHSLDVSGRHDVNSYVCHRKTDVNRTSCIRGCARPDLLRFMHVNPLVDQERKRWYPYSTPRSTFHSGVFWNQCLCLRCLFFRAPYPRRRDGSSLYITLLVDIDWSDRA